MVLFHRLIFLRSYSHVGTDPNITASSISHFERLSGVYSQIHLLAKELAIHFILKYPFKMKSPSSFSKPPLLHPPPQRRRADAQNVRCLSSIPTNGPKYAMDISMFHLFETKQGPIAICYPRESVTQLHVVR